MVHECEPAGVAMREDVHDLAFFPKADRADERESVLADRAARSGVFIGDQNCGLACDGDLLARSGTARDGGELAVHGPGEIHGGGACGFQNGAGLGETFFKIAAARCFERGEVHPPARRCADESRAAHVHFKNRRGHLRNGRDFLDDEAMRQRALVYDLDDAVVAGLLPDGAEMRAVDVHSGAFLIGDELRFVEPRTVLASSPARTRNCRRGRQCSISSALPD